MSRASDKPPARPAEVYWVPGPWPGRLGIVPRPRGGDWLADEVRSWKQAGIDVVTSLLMPAEEVELDLRLEAARCRTEGVEHHSFPIPDRGVPHSRAGMAQLVGRLDEALAGGKTVGVHCRQGLGRSSMLVALLLVSRGIDPIEAFRRIGSARGATVPETTEQREWVLKAA